jgi:hypothetical protein
MAEPVVVTVIVAKFDDTKVTVVLIPAGVAVTVVPSIEVNQVMVPSVPSGISVVVTR